MDEYESLSVFLKPSKKNRKIIVNLFIVILALNLLFGLVLCYTSRYASETSDFDYFFPSTWSNRNIKVRIVVVITALLGFTSKSTILWSISCTFAFISFFCAIMANFSILIMSPDTQCTVVTLLLVLLEIFSMAFIIGLLITLIYQLLTLESDSHVSLDMKSPEKEMSDRLMRSMIHVIPGFGLFARKIAEWTKDN